MKAFTKPLGLHVNRRPKLLAKSNNYNTHCGVVRFAFYVKYLLYELGVDHLIFKILKMRSFTPKNSLSYS